ncbi:E3 ubiquitin-protein ligase hrd1 [Tulasnella sp. 330]|nr:E3 ubiquitin-protein ligase hrd1 [Tulasnella sp. 330]
MPEMPTPIGNQYGATAWVPPVPPIGRRPSPLPFPGTAPSPQYNNRPGPPQPFTPSRFSAPEDPIVPTYQPSIPMPNTRDIPTPFGNPAHDSLRYHSSAEWIEDAKRRATELSMWGPKKSINWALVGDSYQLHTLAQLLVEPAGNIPPTAIQAGQASDGAPLYIARNFHEGGMRKFGLNGYKEHDVPIDLWWIDIGWATRNGASLSWGGAEVPLTTYEVLIGEVYSISWVPSGSVGRGIPIEAGYEADGKPLWAAQVRFGNAVLTGKTAGWDTVDDYVKMPLSAVMNRHRMASYALFSSILVGLVVVNGFRKHSNFYSIAVYLSRSNGSVLALANFGLFLTLNVGRACQRVFFGPLRPVEVERVYDRMWFFVTESLLAFTIFRDEFDTPFVVMFVVLLFLKCFHWILADRIDWMDQVPFPGPGALFHARTVALLFTLWVVDLIMTAIALESLLSHGVGWIILFASEYGILLATLMNSWLKYVIAAYDLRRAATRGGENAPVWEDRSMYIFYIELITDFFKLSIYLIFFGAVMTFYGLPLNVVRDVYITARSFVTRVQDLIRYRSATKNMDQKYPNATREELNGTSDRTCIICREEMVPLEAEAAGQPRDGPNDTPKKLPCGHIFHFHCLRSWLERQQSCPTCRRSVLETAPPTQNNAAAPPVPVPAAPAQPAPGALPIPQRQAGDADRDRDLIAETDALLERLGLRQPGERARNNNPGGGGAGDTATLPPSGLQPTRSSAQGSPASPPAPMQFQGFSVGGVWQPWHHGVPPPTPAPTTKPIPTPTVPATGISGEASSSVNERTSVAEPAATTTHPLDGAPAAAPTPREAAAAAALRRYGGVSGSSLTIPPAATSSSNPPTASSSSSPTPDLSSSAFSSSRSPTMASLSTAPKLIPLFDPSSVSTQLSQRLPSPFTTPFAGFPFASPSPASSHSLSGLQPSGITMPSSSSVAHGLSDSQLEKLDRLTREGIEERLKVLDGVQTSLWKCVEDLTRMRSVLPPPLSVDEDDGVIVDSGGSKGKEKA